AKPSDAFGDWEVRSCSDLPPPDPTETAGSTSLGWQCALTVWTVGDHALPVQDVAYHGQGADGTTKTQPLTVKVVSVLDAQASEIKPLKPQLEMSDPANVLFIVGMIV